MNIDQEIANHIRVLRKKLGYSLEVLSARSGVSKSMISLVERSETSPTAAILNKLADALNVSMASFFTNTTSLDSGSPLAKKEDQNVWTDPDSGYERRHLSPAQFDSPIELAEVIFPPGQKVLFENAVRHIDTYQQIWVLEGEIEITVDTDVWVLSTGDCLAMKLGETIMFQNKTQTPSRYLVALTTKSHG